MNETYPGQFASMASDITKIWDFKACPDHFIEWQARTAVLAVGAVPTIYELISADCADDWISEMINSGGNGLWGCG